jgi:hypothetical protein
MADKSSKGRERFGPVVDIPDDDAKEMMWGAAASKLTGDPRYALGAAGQALKDAKIVHGARRRA